MTKRFTIGFLLSTIFLVAFEYLFLNELFSGKRTLVIVVSLLGVLLASVFFALFFKKYRKADQDS